MIKVSIFSLSLFKIAGLMLIGVGALFQWGYDYVDTIILPALGTVEQYDDSALASLTGELNSGNIIRLLKNVLGEYRTALS